MLWVRASATSRGENRNHQRPNSVKKKKKKISTLITGLIRTLSASVWECFGCVRCVQGADPCRSGRTLQSLHHHRYLIGSKEPPVFSRSRREPFPHDMQASGPAGKTHRRDDHQSETTLLDFTHWRERDRERKRKWAQAIFGRNNNCRYNDRIIYSDYNLCLKKKNQNMNLS